MPAAPNAPYVVMEGIPPKVLLIDPVRFEATDVIWIAPHAVFSLVSPARDALFVLHNSCGKQETTLSIVDLRTKQIRKTVPLTPNVASLAVSQGGRCLIGVDLGGKDGSATVNVVDTGTGAGLRIPAGHSIRQWITTRDASRVFVLSAAKPGSAPRHSQFFSQPEIGIDACKKAGRVYRTGADFSVLVLDPGSAKPVATIPVPGDPSAMLLSPDERWLYVIDQGVWDKTTGGFRGAKVHSIETQNCAMVATRTLKTSPRALDMDGETGELWVLAGAASPEAAGEMYRFHGSQMAGPTAVRPKPLGLVRLDGLPHPLLTTEDEICQLGGDGTPQRPCIELSKLHLAQEGTAMDSHRLPRFEVRYLPTRSAFAIRTGQYGDRLIVVDPQAPQPTALLTLGRPGARAATRVWNVARFGQLAGLPVGPAIGAACQHSGYGGCGISWFWDWPKPTQKDPWGSPPSVLGPGGRYLYTINLYTNDLAVVDTESQKVDAYFPMHAVAGALTLLPRNRLLCMSSQRIVVLDTTTNKAVLDVVAPDIGEVDVPDGVPRIVAAFPDSVSAWDLETLKPVGTVGSLREPRVAAGQ